MCPSYFLGCKLFSELNLLHDIVTEISVKVRSVYYTFDVNSFRVGLIDCCIVENLWNKNALNLTRYYKTTFRDMNHLKIEKVFNHFWPGILIRQNVVSTFSKILWKFKPNPDSWLGQPPSPRSGFHHFWRGSGGKPWVFCSYLWNHVVHGLENVAIVIRNTQEPSTMHSEYF